MANRVKKTAEQSADLARKIWLAGVGAYGRAYTETRDGLEQATSMSSEMFDDLVERGTKIEAEVRTSVSSNDRINKVVEAAGKFGARRKAGFEGRKARFEERVGAVRKGLGLNRGIFTMDQKLEALTEQLDALAREVSTIKKAVAKPARKASVKKAVKKAAPKKAAAKTTATKPAAPKAV
ncbi:MAG: hypothetical protein COA47_03940 [Robiginitomaculum sp.]|nr:MAG: hypothetical protein COA47_03940 [Robiginitomaculum sp.]